jgi:hypothetical protein
MRCCRRAPPPPGSMLCARRCPSAVGHRRRQAPCSARAAAPVPRAASPAPRAAGLPALRRRRAPAPRAAALAPRADGIPAQRPPGSLLCTAAGLPTPAPRAAIPAPRAAIPAPRVFAHALRAGGILAQRAAEIPAPVSASAGHTCSGERPRWSELGKKKDLTSGPLQN